MYVNIAVLKETTPGEHRVALVPDVVPGLIKLGARLHMESGAADGIGLADTDFSDVVVISDRSVLVADADVVLCVQPPALEVIDAMKPGAVLICYVNNDLPLLKHLLDRKITCFAIEKLPRVTRAQSMDALSSQAALAGYSAVMLGAAALARVLPKVTTAAGTIGPAHVLVMGLGVAGLEALATAHRLGAVTEGYDVRPETREQALSLGSTFVDTGVDATGKGGYARALTTEEKAKVANALTTHIQSADLIITTAAIPGKPSPKLISTKQVAGMRPGAVIVDLAAEGGGNCEDSVPGETLKVGAVTILAPLNVGSMLAEDASKLYAKNLANFLGLMLHDNILTVDVTDEILSAAVLSHDGKRLNAPAPATPKSSKSAAEVA
ncbi:NAD(P) transhydrogenase subunit alpha [Roseovarius arcticus]|uniref:NAD(P) transhydrogenase subunit alpha n=1 Tax=Roseovarius arcticus TaxID=2547404 RepID=UPI0011104630|nr:NAD(P) transhydrogenase subunit alpha [Roseovarius arcticus]